MFSPQSHILEKGNHQAKLVVKYQGSNLNMTPKKSVYIKYDKQTCLPMLPALSNEVESAETLVLSEPWKVIKLNINVTGTLSKGRLQPGYFISNQYESSLGGRIYTDKIHPNHFQFEKEALSAGVEIKGYQNNNDIYTSTTFRDLLSSQNQGSTTYKTQTLLIYVSLK